MKKYRNLTFIGNLIRRKVIVTYKEKIEQYFKLIDYNEYDRSIIDNDKSQPIRTYLNKNLEKINRYLNEADVIPTVIHTDPPMLGGRRSYLSLTDNLFNLQNYDIEPQAVIDSFDQALGIYEQDFLNSIARTINPLFWFSKLLELIASIPFYLLGGIGFNRQKLEDSLWGKMSKWVIKVMTLFVTIWQCLIFVGVIPTNLSLLQLFRH